ncbi:hypothetical protein C2845_PM02G46000 [Panicum miliaceum]|uniref:Uncharacterized protein n=1 Tax=Panicum miliaceum TaxID=4540 RepID=A0A3L6SGB1_PANMI|nr:hypothetical protein C2845_PM02G46000 [Panicum miliaceum]
MVLLLAILCAGPGHALRLLNDVDGGREFSFGSKAAAAVAETEPLDPSLSNDYENEISHVEFEPELGSTAPFAAAAAPVPAATTTVNVAAAEPSRVRKAAATAAAEAAGARSMKWWLPPSTMPSFPLFPNPGGMPGMPFHPIGGWGVPAPPDQSPPTPPAAATTNANDPNANGGIN